MIRIINKNIITIIRPIIIYIYINYFSNNNDYIRPIIIITNYIINY